MNKSNHFLASILNITVLIIAVKLLSFLREVIMAASFGASASVDAYNIAWSVTDMFMLLLSSYLSTTLIPTFKLAQKEGGEAAANRFSNNMLHMVSVIGFALSAIGALVAPWLIWLLARSFDPERYQLAVSLLRQMIWAVPFMTMGMFFSGYLNANDRFAGAQLLQFPISLCVIIACLAFRKHEITAVGIAFFIGAILQPLVQLPSLRRTNFRYKPVLDFKDAHLRQTLLLAIPVLLGSAVQEIAVVVDKSLASSFPVGSVASLGYASRLINLCNGVLIVPLSTVLFTKMSEHIAAGRQKTMLRQMHQGMQTLSFLLFPIVAVSVVCRKEIVQIVYERGSFDEAATAVTSMIFAYYILGLVGLGLTTLLTRGFYALQDAKTPMLNGIAAIVLDIILSIALSRLWGIGGLALGTAIANTLRPFILYRSLRKRFREQIGAMQPLRFLTKNLFCAVGSTGSMILARTWLNLPSPLLRFVVFAGIGCGIYLLLSVLIEISLRGIRKHTHRR